MSSTLSRLSPTLSRLSSTLLRYRDVPRRAQGRVDSPFVQGVRYAASLFLDFALSFIPPSHLNHPPPHLNRRQPRLGRALPRQGFLRYLRPAQRQDRLLRAVDAQPAPVPAHGMQALPRRPAAHQARRGGAQVHSGPHPRGGTQVLQGQLSCSALISFPFLCSSHPLQASHLHSRTHSLPPIPSPPHACTITNVTLRRAEEAVAQAVLRGHAPRLLPPRGASRPLAPLPSP